MASNQVTLEVYDLSNGMAAAMSQAILGMRIDGMSLSFLNRCKIFLNNKYILFYAYFRNLAYRSCCIW